MVNKCCVPGCTSHYKSTDAHVPCCKFPSDEVHGKIQRKIARKGLIVTKDSVVCSNHFQDCDVIKEDVIRTNSRNKWPP